MGSIVGCVDTEQDTNWTRAVYSVPKEEATDDSERDPTHSKKFEDETEEAVFFLSHNILSDSFVSDQLSWLVLKFYLHRVYYKSLSCLVFLVTHCLFF